MTRPLVSVLVLSYNHARFVVSCLEGILMQRLDAPCEIVVGDDGSTDGTLDILRSYRRRFPRLIQLVEEGRRVGLYDNLTRCVQACRGEYVATCEGDDYWIDPLKLSKQLRFFAEHPEGILCGHNSLVLFDGPVPAVRFFNPRPPVQPITVASLLDSVPGIYPMHASSYLLRAAVLVDLFAKVPEVMAGDQLVLLWSAHQGQIGYLDDTMSVYRKHVGGLTARGSATHLRLYEDTETRLRAFNAITDSAYEPLTRAYLRRSEAILRPEVLKRKSRWLYAVRYAPQIALRALRLFASAWRNRH